MPTVTLSPATTLDARIARLRRMMAADRLDTLVVEHRPNLFYLTNIRASAGLLCVKRDDAALDLIIDFRYETAVRDAIDAGITPPGLRLVPVTETYDETLATTLDSSNGARVGLEADHMSVRRWQWLVARTSAELVPTCETVERLRMVKSVEEIDRLRRAGAMLANLVPKAAEAATAGRTERDIARTIDALLIAAGFERPAFETIVASGPNSALPHAHPTTRVLEIGDLVILDFGGVHTGYCVDISRTVVVGRKTAEAVRLHRAVADAQLTAIATAAPGVAATTVDGAAREALARHRLAEAFGHSTGHGLGLEVHELPRLGRRRGSAGDDLDLTDGMAFTIEPGVYVPGTGGVRIEDDLVVTPGGAEVLTPAPRDLVVT